MKAAIWTKYGSPEVLKLSEINKPVPKDNEVLIRIHATTVTAGDCEMRNLKFPLFLSLPMRLYAGILKPTRINILGHELAGNVRGPAELPGLRHQVPDRPARPLLPHDVPATPALRPVRLERDDLGPRRLGYDFEEAIAVLERIVLVIEHLHLPAAVAVVAVGEVLVELAELRQLLGLVERDVGLLRRGYGGQRSNPQRSLA